MMPSLQVLDPSPSRADSVPTEAALAEQQHTFDRAVVLGDAGVVGDAALGADAQRAVGEHAAGIGA